MNSVESAKMMVLREELETGSVFLSTKINKIRWHPSKFTYRDGAYTGIVAVGSYDETVNKISVYEIKLGNFPPEMNRLCTQNIKGGASDLQFVHDESRRTSLLLGSTFDGDLVVYETINLKEITMRKLEKQANGAYPDLAYIGSLSLHHGSLTSMDVSTHREVVTAGSDGVVQIVDLGESIKPMRKIEVNGAAIKCVRYTSAGIVVASNQITFIDLRSNSKIPIKSEKGIGFQSIAPHPHQGNFICSGASDGTVCVWDLRATALPLTTQNLHRDHVWEMHFLPAQSDAVVSCASDTLALVNYNPENALTHDFGAKVRARRELALVHAQERVGLNACDAHESGVVLGAGDSGCVVLAKLPTPHGGETYGLLRDENNYV
eukprot:Phypoly_transcript_10216.p1 GENE.Phypoly_transcript_10216~~Phypoly_transcript_10216.p1  ORF type:complete len:377 (+),score=82.43 Phypoly_transcript_10216:173-1303(+)